MLKELDPTPEQIRLSLGEVLRGRRKELRFSMQHVADQAGLSVGFISQVERGLTSPSLGSLASIAKVLDLRLGEIMDTQGQGQETTRKTARPVYRIPGAEQSYERISTAFEGSKLHSVIVHEPPGHRIEPISHVGEEIFFILAGSITVEIEGKVDILSQGDTIHFDSRRVHSAWNHTDQPASILWCGTMDVFGDAPEPIHKTLEKDGQHTSQTERTTHD